MKMYAIMDIHFKFLAKRGHGWEIDVDKAKFYDKLSAARSKATIIAIETGFVPSIVVFDLYQSAILSEVDRVKEVIAKKEEKRVKREEFEKEWKIKNLQKQAEEANRKLQDLLTSK